MDVQKLKLNQSIFENLSQKYDGFYEKIPFSSPTNNVYTVSWWSDDEETDDLVDYIQAVTFRSYEIDLTAKEIKEKFGLPPNSCVFRERNKVLPFWEYVITFHPEEWINEDEYTLLIL